MKEITFVRHGQSAANAGGLAMANALIPLTPLGHLHAKTVAPLLPEQPTQILTSAFLRARETAQPYEAKTGGAARVHPLVHEFSTLDHSQIVGLTTAEQAPHIDAYWGAADPAARHGALAETFLEFEERVSGFLNELPTLQHGTVVFSHGMWIALMAWRLLGFTARDRPGMQAFRRFQLGFPMPNGAVYRLVQSASGHWHVQANEPAIRTLLAVRL